MTRDQALDTLRSSDRDIQRLSHTSAALGWDQETYMPTKSIRDRAGQLSLLQALIHRLVVGADNGKAFAILGCSEDHSSGASDLSDEDRAFLRQAYRRYTQATKLPERLVVKLAETTSKGQAVWQAARENNDFPAFRPILEEIVALVTEKAELLGYEDHIYDPLLDEYEPGLTTGDVTSIFAELQNALVDLLGRVKAVPQVDESFLQRSFDVDHQRTFGIEVLTALGFEFDRGRLDVSAHPFTTTLGFDDVRITTRYNPHSFKTALFGTIHEAGHALYELGFAESLRGTILADGTSLGIHESQSRFWENVVGRSRLFWRLYFPRMKELFPDALTGVDEDCFFRGINRVQPSLIRVEADEVTYGLHIILRFQLELALLTGDLTVADLPEAWRELSKELLGVSSESDAEGVLQDIHWSMGAFGYFPTYALGNLYAAQFISILRRDLPQFESLIEAGDFVPILDWLRKHIHRHGSSHLPGEILGDVVGAGLSSSEFVDYLERKYRDVYELS